jgi:molybdenum cofactor cytidylyltransferase
MKKPGFDAIVLAGGASTRMGEPKALLVVRGATLLEHHLAGLGRASTLVVVTGPHHALIAAHVADLDAGNVLLAVNPDVASGPFASLRLGLRALGRARRPVVVLPVDVPPLAGFDLAPLLEAAETPEVAAVVATHLGRDGHPVVLGPAALAAVASAPASGTLREVLAGLGSAVVRVPTSEPGVLSDLDTPADLEHYLRTHPST